MTHNEINPCPTCSTDKYSTVIDKTPEYCLRVRKYDGRTVWYLKTPGVPIFKRSKHNQSRTAHPRSKDSFYCKVVSKLDQITTRICKTIRKEFERNRHPIFGGFSPKWQGTPSGKENSIDHFSLNTIVID